ncbi:MAG: antibiotic biosynthesis monooxygenase [Moraxella sp.]|nr:antibiotic biosynthesis monooxygenase [Moraxella sp.]
MSKVILEGYIVIPKAEKAEVLQALDEHIALTRAESGCLVFDIRPDQMDECVYHVYEEFVDKAAFESHQARVRASDWRRASANVARHYKPLRN